LKCDDRIKFSTEGLTFKEYLKPAHKLKLEQDTYRESSTTRQLEGSILNLLAASKNLTP